MTARISYKPCLSAGNLDVAEDLSALVIRPIGRGSLEELVFRMDILYRLERQGMYVVNPPEAIEHCVDKYDILSILEENSIPVPRTAVTENASSAVEAFKELGGDVVVKPIFGSRGMGSTRVTDPEIASTVFKAIAFYHGLIYMQEFVNHGFSDLRVLVVGKRVIAAMRRVAEGWKANYSQGARPTSIGLDNDIEDMAVRSAGLINCKIAGIDILEGPHGPVVVDVNSQPGWRGLQTVTEANIADEIVDFVLSDMEK